MEELKKMAETLCCKKKRTGEKDPTSNGAEDPSQKITRFLEKWGIRNGTPEEEKELASLKFTAYKTVKHIEAETKLMSKRHNKQLR